MADAGYEALVAGLSTNSNLLDSIKAFLQNVAVKVAEARAAGASEKDALLGTLAETLKSKDDEIAALMVSGTPAAPPAPSTTP